MKSAFLFRSSPRPVAAANVARNVRLFIYTLFTKFRLDLKSSLTLSIGSMKTLLIFAVVVSTLIASDTVSPFACDRAALNPEQRKRHFDELGPELRTLVKSVRELPNGYEFEFPAEWTSITKVAEWAAGERLCCPFFDIDLRLDHEHGAFWLRLTGREGTKQFVAADFSKWMNAAAAHR